MQIHQIVRIHKNKKSVAVGRGSKRGKTSGRGTKGQNARAGHKNRPEFRDIIKKLPKLRGRGKNSNVSIQNKPAIVNVALLEEHFENGALINREALLAKGLINKRGGVLPEVKILGDGELKKKFTFAGLHFSKSARAKAGLKEIIVEVKPVEVKKAPEVKKAAEVKKAVKEPKKAPEAKREVKKEAKPTAEIKKN